ncbi:MAG: hypothetical protein MMC33_009463 [Icmadophila ericetorum]|nr:hypothetical protein [Icmadophila ericetorum]
MPLPYRPNVPELRIDTSGSAIKIFSSSKRHTRQASMSTDGDEATPPAPDTMCPPANPFGRGLEDPATPRPPLSFNHVPRGAPPSFNLEENSNFGRFTCTDPTGFDRTMPTARTIRQSISQFDNRSALPHGSRSNKSSQPAVQLRELPPPPPNLRLSNREFPKQCVCSQESPGKQQAATNTRMGPQQVHTRGTAQELNHSHQTASFVNNQGSACIPATSSVQLDSSSSISNSHVQNWLEDVFIDHNDGYMTASGGRQVPTIDPHPFAPTLREVVQNSMVSTNYEQHAFTGPYIPAKPPSIPNSTARIRATDTKMPLRQPVSSPLKSKEGPGSQGDVTAAKPRTPRQGSRTFSSVEEAKAYSDIYGGGSKIVQTPRGDVSIFTPSRRPSQLSLKIAGGEESVGPEVSLTTGRRMHIDSPSSNAGYDPNVSNTLEAAMIWNEVQRTPRAPSSPIYQPADPPSPLARSASTSQASTRATVSSPDSPPTLSPVRQPTGPPSLVPHPPSTQQPHTPSPWITSTNTPPPNISPIRQPQNPPPKPIAIATAESNLSTNSTLHISNSETTLVIPIPIRNPIHPPVPVLRGTITYHRHLESHISSPSYSHHHQQQQRTAQPINPSVQKVFDTVGEIPTVEGTTTEERVQRVTPSSVTYISGISSTEMSRRELRVPMVDESQGSSREDGDGSSGSISGNGVADVEKRERTLWEGFERRGEGGWSVD